jgi:hypothetical protein
VPIFLELHQHGIFCITNILGPQVISDGLLLQPNLGFTLSWFAFVGQLLLPLWLVVKGVDAEI